MRFSLLFLLPLIALSACGKSDSSDSSTGGTVASAPSGVSIPAGVATQIVVSPDMHGDPNYYFLNYRFIENGCDTGLRRFSGPTAWYVRQQYCQALLNDSMNQRCAQTTRQAFFQRDCAGGI